ncbi:MAG TPA: OsmC family protein [Terriglobales bacterium]|nr:OsmC family protein [Terriglobales bacterium]
MAEVRRYTVSAASTDTFGRVLCRARNHHVVVDGPEQNGCPGEEITPVEVFLAAVAACGVELMQVIARDEKLPLKKVAVEISSIQDRSRPVRRDVSLFNSVHVKFRLDGVNQQEGERLIGAFKGR